MERQERQERPQDGSERDSQGELREEDVTAGDRLDDRVQEGDGLKGEPDPD